MLVRRRDLPPQVAKGYGSRGMFQYHPTSHYRFFRCWIPLTQPLSHPKEGLI